MDSINMNVRKDSQKEENTVHCAIKSKESNGESLSKLDPDEQTLIPKFRRSRSSSSSLELFLPNSHGRHSTIPKHITTFDEKYVLHCLELIRSCALRAAAGNFASKVHILPDDLSNLGSYDMAKLSIGSPLVASTDEWTIGSITNSQSMMNILKSPLLQKFGSIDFDVNFGKKSLLDFAGSPQKSSNMLSQKPQNEVTLVDHEYVSGPGHKRLLSISSTNSSFSDKTSSSASATSFQGMLQSRWINGLPHHVFNVDDKKEVYVANLSKVESLDDNGSDYIYTFRSKGKKDQQVELESLGTMRVSTSITFCSDNSEVRQTQFILSVSSDDSKRELEISNHTHRKNRTLTKKMGKVLRSSLSYKQRSHSKFSVSSAIFEDSPWEPSEDVHNSIENHVPNLELAAIVMKDISKADLGGWGLKFLKKSRNNAFVPSECNRSNGACSTSMNIIIPAGIHGGPKTKVGGPSSIIERWISGGDCDCGGWDMGCPLTILKTGSSSRDSSSGECMSVDLFKQGSKEDVPMLKMVNIHEGLYYIHFQSTLSTLQTFAIAAAIIHSRSPLLRSKVYRS